MDVASAAREQIYGAIRAFTSATVAEAEAATKAVVRVVNNAAPDVDNRISAALEPFARIGDYMQASDGWAPSDELDLVARDGGLIAKLESSAFQDAAAIYQSLGFPDDGGCIRCSAVPRSNSGLCNTCLDEDAVRIGEAETAGDCFTAMRTAYVALSFAFSRLHGSARSRDTELCNTFGKARAGIETAFKSAGVKL